MEWKTSQGKEKISKKFYIHHFIFLVFGIRFALGGFWSIIGIFKSDSERDCEEYPSKWSFPILLGSRRTSLVASKDFNRSGINQLVDLFKVELVAMFLFVPVFCSCWYNSYGFIFYMKTLKQKKFTHGLWLLLNLKCIILLTKVIWFL